MSPGFAAERSRLTSLPTNPSVPYPSWVADVEGVAGAGGVAWRLLVGRGAGAVDPACVRHCERRKQHRVRFADIAALGLALRSEKPAAQLQL